MSSDSHVFQEEEEKGPTNEEPEGPVSTYYKLKGIVVHSGQASGGHYYSYIQIRYVT